MKAKSILILLFLSATPFAGGAQEIGLQLYSLRNQFKTDVTGTLDIIESWGVTKLEGGETYGMSVEDFKKELAVEI